MINKQMEMHDNAEETKYKNANFFILRTGAAVILPIHNVKLFFGEYWSTHRRTDCQIVDVKELVIETVKVS